MNEKMISYEISKCCCTGYVKLEYCFASRAKSKSRKAVGAYSSISDCKENARRHFNLHFKKRGFRMAIVEKGKIPFILRESDEERL